MRKNEFHQNPAGSNVFNNQNTENQLS